jgi:hypothetical protein
MRFSWRSRAATPACDRTIGEAMGCASLVSVLAEHLKN